MLKEKLVEAESVNAQLRFVAEELREAKATADTRAEALRTELERVPLPFLPLSFFLLFDMYRFSLPRRQLSSLSFPSRQTSNFRLFLP